MAAGVLVGCASGKPEPSADPPLAVGERPAGFYGPDPPLALDPILADAEAAPEVAEAPAVVSAVEPEPEATAPQGPPDWWFSGERRDGASVIVCAAGFGADLPRARDAAIEAARQRLLLFVPGGTGELDAGRVERLSVMPLPSARSAARYVGYAMVSTNLN